MEADAFYDFERYNLIEDQTQPLHFTTQKKALVICLENDINEANTQLLDKILSAINLSIQDVEIIIQPTGSILNITQLLRDCEPNVMLSFHVNLNKNGLNIEQKLYQPIILMNTSIIISQALSHLQNDNQAKAKLWNAIKHYKD